MAFDLRRSLDYGRGRVEISRDLEYREGRSIELESVCMSACVGCDSEESVDQSDHYNTEISLSISLTISL